MPMQNISSIYIGAIIACIALCMLGAILRIQAARRSRARLNAFAVPSIPVYPHNQNATMPMYAPPVQPPGNFPPSPHYGQRQSWTTPPAFPNPAFPPPRDPSYPPPPSTTYPRNSYVYPTTPSSPKFSPNPPSGPPAPPSLSPNATSLPTAPQSNSGSHATSSPPTVLEKSPPRPPSEQMNLVDRMREVQTLMLEIHRLESDPGPNHRSRIQELQRRVTELSDTQNSNVASSNQVLGPPPAYVQAQAQDGRD